MKHQALHIVPGQYDIVHRGTIHNSPKMETTQMNIVDTNNGILFGYKKELNTEIYYNKDDP